MRGWVLLEKSMDLIIFLRMGWVVKVLKCKGKTGISLVALNKNGDRTRNKSDSLKNGVYPVD